MREHPVKGAVLSGASVFFASLADIEVWAAMATAVVTTGLVYGSVRPGGWGPKVDEWNRRQIEANDGREVRTEWVVRAAIIVSLVILGPVMLGIVLFP